MLVCMALLGFVIPPVAIQFVSRSPDRHLFKRLERSAWGLPDLAQMAQRGKQRCSLVTIMKWMIFDESVEQRCHLFKRSRPLCEASEPGSLTGNSRDEQ